MTSSTLSGSNSRLCSPGRRPGLSSTPTPTSPRILLCQSVKYTRVSAISSSLGRRFDSERFLRITLGHRILFAATSPLSLLFNYASRTFVLVFKCFIFCFCFVLLLRINREVCLYVLSSHLFSFAISPIRASSSDSTASVSLK
jgi:hypothetical protein